MRATTICPSEQRARPLQQSGAPDPQVFFAACRQRLLARLREILPPPGEPIADAMRYATLGAADGEDGGGKRLRPLLVYATGHCLGGDFDALDPLACCLELVHCYSLVHDDLPCMDDAPLRRGAPSCHLRFGEATAVLAGDALQPLAFRLLADAPSNGDPDRTGRLLRELADACGWNGMVRGQMLDLDLDGLTGPDEQRVEEMHRLKTAALIEAAVAMAAIQCGVAPGAAEERQLRRFAADFGLAFQVNDDLLDVIGDVREMGKCTGADGAADKVTAVTVLGVEGARQKADSLCDRALKHLQPFGDSAAPLRALVDFARPPS